MNSKTNIIHDSIIIGTGPSGLAASIYASRYGLKHLIIGVLQGGTATEAFIVENYPGFKSISGNELMQKFIEHVKRYKPEIIPTEVSRIRKQGNYFEIETGLNKTLKTKTVILALGVHHRTLSIVGEKKFLGKGVSYCHTCDGPLFKNKIVGVVGGGDGALTAALFLSNHAKRVYLIHRRKEFRGQIAWQNSVAKNKKIIKILQRQVKEIRGNKFVKEIILDFPYKTKKSLKIDGLFIEIGTLPSGRKIIFEPPLNLKRDKSNYIVTDRSMQTNIPGIFAAGDITGPPEKLRQILTASAEGSIAAVNAQRFCLKSQNFKTK